MTNPLLPSSLYKLIPLIYIGLGIYIWVKLDTVYALISGTMMVGAGILALLMRQRGASDIDETLDTWTGEIPDSTFKNIPMKAPPVTGISVTKEIYTPPHK